MVIITYNKLIYVSFYYSLRDLNIAHGTHSREWRQEGFKANILVYLAFTLKP